MTDTTTEQPEQPKTGKMNINDVMSLILSSEDVANQLADAMNVDYDEIIKLHIEWSKTVYEGLQYNVLMGIFCQGILNTCMNVVIDNPDIPEDERMIQHRMLITGLYMQMLMMTETAHVELSDGQTVS